MSIQPHLPPNTETQATWLDDDPGDLDTGGAASGRTLGRFRLIALLGEGSVGTVYRAWDSAVGDEVALKVFRAEDQAGDDWLEALRREVRLSRKISHPNVLRTYDLGTADGEQFLTMELVQGRSLGRMLAEVGALPVARALVIGHAVAEGLAAAHAADVTHCDLKPDNIVVGDDGRVVITDFGIARRVGARPGVATGQPCYQAPEVSLGAAMDARVDIYAWGAVLYEVLTGQRLWDGATAAEVGRLRTLGPVPDLSARGRIPEALARVLSRALAPDPAARFQSARQLADALAEVEAVTTGEPAPPPIWTGASSVSTLAVLPFRAGEEDESLAECLWEEVIDALSAARTVRVRRLDTRRPDPGDPAELGRALGVSAVVEGGLRRVGDQHLLSVRLISVADGFQVWGARFPVRDGDTFRVADQAAIAIAGALATELPIQPRANLGSADAMDLYLAARKAERANYFQGMVTAIPLYERALVLAPEDPDLLSAYSSALCRQAFQARGGASARDGLLARARWAAERAIATATQSGEAWMALGTSALYQGDVAAFAVALRNATRCAPGLPRAQQALGGLLGQLGQVEAALAHLQSAILLDPALLQAYVDLARTQALAGLVDALYNTLEAFPAQSPSARALLTLLARRLLLWRPDWAGLTRWAALAAPPWQGPMADLADALAEACTRPGLPAALRAEEADDDEVHPLQRAIRWQAWAEICAVHGEIALGLRWMERVLESGLPDLLWMDACRALAPLRASPAWEALRVRASQSAARVQAALDDPAV